MEFFRTTAGLHSRKIPNLLRASAALQDFKDSRHQHGWSWWTTGDIGVHGKNRIDRTDNVLIRCECAVLRLDRGCPG